MIIRKLLLQIFAFLISVNFSTPVFGAFFQLEHGFSGTQITSLFALFSLSVFIFEIPTGILSDCIGEKKSLLVAVVITTMANIFFVYGNTELVFAGEFIYGIGSTFFSGPFESLVYKYCKEENSINYDAFISKIFSMEWMGLCFSFFLSYVFSKFISIKMCFYMTIIVNLISILCVLVLPKTERESISTKSIPNIMRNFMTDTNNNSQLKTVFLLNVTFSVLLVSGYQILQTYLLDNNSRQEYNGVIYFIAAIFASMGSLLYDKLQKKVNSKMKLLVACMLLITLCFSGLAITGNFILIFILICLYRAVWGITSPMYTALINRSISQDDYRNTAFSMLSLASNLFQSILLAIFAATGFGVRINYICLSVISILLLIFCFYFKVSINI